MAHPLTEYLVRGSVLCLLCAVALRLLRRASAAQRHMLCVLALLSLPALPWMRHIVPALPVLPPEAAAAGHANPGRPAGAPGLPFAGSEPQSPPSREPVAQPPAALRPSAEGGPHRTADGANLANPAYRPVARPERISALLFGIWAVGVGFLLVRLVCALARLHILEARSEWAAIGDTRVRISDSIATPLTWGIRRSVIMLPTALLSDEELCASAIRHERAHIDRWDWVWNLAAELVCISCWFQPGAWWLRGRMRSESERASDDRVLLSGIDAAQYAAHLIQISRSLSNCEIAPAMARPGGMEDRVTHILDYAAPRRAPAHWMAVAIPGALALLSIAALRVSARPVDTRPTNPGAVRAGSASTASGHSRHGDHRAGSNVRMAQAGGPPAATAIASLGPMVMLKDVTWGKPADGVEPGLLLVDEMVNKTRRAPLNYRIRYQILVRNSSAAERLMEVRCGGSTTGQRDPYLVPTDRLRAASAPGQLEPYRSIGVTDLSLVAAAYYVKLAPGEAVVLPQELGLYVGAADQHSFPRVESVRAGLNSIIQPVSFHLLTGAARDEAQRAIDTRYSQKVSARIVSRTGRNDNRDIPVVGARTGGTVLLAAVQLDIGSNREWTLKGDTSAVNVVTFSPDSKRLVAGSAAGDTIIWDAISGRSVRSLKAGDSPITSVVFTPDGKLLITGDEAGKIRIWNPSTGESIRALEVPGGKVSSLSVAADNAVLLAGYAGGVVVAWDIGRGQSIATFNYDSRLLSAAISPTGKRIAAGYADSTLKIWDVQTHRTVKSIKLEHAAGITSVHYDRNSTLYAWDSEVATDGVSKLSVMTAWDDNGSILGKILCPVPANTVCNAVSYDDLTMLSGLAEGQALLNDPHVGPVTLDAHEGPVSAVAISPDGSLAATAGSRNGRGEAKIWDVLAHRTTGGTK